MDVVFAIPCQHAAAKDGFFYCVPTYYKKPQMWDMHTFLVVDTNKVIGQIQARDPGFLQNSDNSLKLKKVAEWLENNSKTNPMDMGLWNYNTHRELVLPSSRAVVISLAEELDLPYFPITMEKSIGETTLDKLHRKFGYKGEDCMRPMMSSRGLNLGGPPIK